MIGENNFISKHIDTFRLIAELQSGQLNTSYKAEQLLSTRRIVVFKLFHAVHLREAKRERFLQEIRLLKKVKHAHILSLLDAGFYEDSPYIVTEYAPHGSLRDRLNAQTTALLPMQEAIAIISDIGRALQFFHQINIIHRNLKPENILFNEHGETLLADCSIMTIADSLPVELAHNTNTFPYLAPEQFHDRTNKESDQYALGCITYELLTGIAPFAGSTFHSIAKEHAKGELIPPTQLNMLLPEYMQKAIVRAMATQETNRYPHIKDFVAALTSSAKPQHITTVAANPAVTDVPNDPFPLQETILPLSHEDSPGITLQDEKPPDTPIIDEHIDPIAPVQQESLFIAPPLTSEENMDSPPNTPDTLDTPDTPPQATKDDENSQYAPQSETSVMAAEDDFFEDDIPTQPGIEVLPAQNYAFASAAANNQTAGVGEPYNVYVASTAPGVAPAALAALAAPATPAAPNTPFGGNLQNNQLQLAKKLTLLVGISWVVIAALVLSIIFIVLPSAHSLTNGDLAISQKSAQQPTVKPRAQPTPVPTPRPTPRPMPSPTPKPTPSPMPSPTPSPTPVPGLTVSPTSLDAHHDCVPFGNYYKCNVTLSLPQNHADDLHWSATTSGNVMALFAPTRGTLSPGQQQLVFVFVKKPCPQSGNLIFQTPDTKFVVSWSC